MSSATTISGNMPVNRQTLTALARFYRRVVLGRLELLKDGRLTIVEGAERMVFGRQSPACRLDVTVTVHDPRFYRAVALGGNGAAGEAYADGLWDCDDLPGLICLFARAEDALDAISGGWARLTSPLRTVAHWLRRNTRRNSRKNIHEHYDRGNEFFSLLLDPTMSYSCAVFDGTESSLEEASIAKNDRICRKLSLRPGDRIMEIGTGWGGFAIHAARHYGCHVTSTTISQSQYRYAQRRVSNEGLEDRITLIEQDYRDLAGQFDKLVSIEMIEAVGDQYYDTFFRKCCELLKPDGMMLLQAITIADHRYERARRNVDFIKRCIFPAAAFHP